MRNEKGLSALFNNNRLQLLNYRGLSKQSALYYPIVLYMYNKCKCHIRYNEAYMYVTEEMNLHKKRAKNSICILVYFGLFDRALFDEYGILTSEELQKAIPCDIDERYRLIDKPRVRKDKKKAQKQPQQNEELLSVEALKDELNDASVEMIAKSVGTTDQSFIRATLEEFIAYQREIGNADNRTMKDMKKHFINFCKKKLKHNGASTNSTNTRNEVSVHPGQRWGEYKPNIETITFDYTPPGPESDVPF